MNKKQHVWWAGLVPIVFCVIAVLDYGCEPRDTIAHPDEEKVTETNNNDE